MDKHVSDLCMLICIYGKGAYCHMPIIICEASSASQRACGGQALGIPHRRTMHAYKDMRTCSVKEGNTWSDSGSSR